MKAATKLYQDIFKFKNYFEICFRVNENCIYHLCAIYLSEKFVHQLWPLVLACFQAMFMVNDIEDYFQYFQSSSAILQGIPRLVFTLLAGPLTDIFGRKLFIIIPLLGHLILNIVYLVNSVWFHQLKVLKMRLEFLFVVLCIKDSYHLCPEEQKKALDAERDTNQLRCDRGNILS